MHLIAANNAEVAIDYNYGPCVVSFMLADGVGYCEHGKSFKKITFFKNLAVFFA